MKKSIILILGLALMLALVSCGGNQELAKVEAEEGQKVMKVYQPYWYDVQSSEASIYFFGEAEKKNANMAFDAARANTMARSAEYVEVYVQSMTKNYMEEVGIEDPTTLALTSNVTKTIASAKFSGLNVSKRETIKLENGNYKTFVRISLPKKTVNKNMVDEIKKEEELYNQFKASQAFEEMEKSVESY